MCVCVKALYVNTFNDPVNKSSCKIEVLKITFSDWLKLYSLGGNFVIATKNSFLLSLSLSHTFFPIQIRIYPYSNVQYKLFEDENQLKRIVWFFFFYNFFHLTAKNKTMNESKHKKMCTHSQINRQLQCT